MITILHVFFKEIYCRFPGPSISNCSIP